MNTWLHSPPPWRMPKIRAHYHHAQTTPILRWLAVATVFATIWYLEFAIWATVWCYYALILGARWTWRHNPIGRTADSIAATRERRTPAPYDPHSAPRQYVDLAALGDDRRS